MKKLAASFLGLALCGLVPTRDLDAHHGTAQFDETKPTTISGFVTKVDWRNPHVHIYLNVYDDSGRVANWAVETSSITDLAIQGWTVEKLRVGAELTITGSLAKPDSGLGIRAISSRYLIFAVKKPLLIGPSIASK